MLSVELSSKTSRAFDFTRAILKNEISRHYTQLAERHGVNNGFYPLGSCTMKYNPKIDEEVASFKGFTNIHPLQDTKTAQGALEAISLAS